MNLRLLVLPTFLLHVASVMAADTSPPGTPKPMRGDYQIYGGTLSEMLPPHAQRQKGGVHGGGGSGERPFPADRAGYRQGKCLQRGKGLPGATPRGRIVRAHEKRRIQLLFRTRPQHWKRHAWRHLLINSSSIRHQILDRPSILRHPLQILLRRLGNSRQITIFHQIRQLDRLPHRIERRARHEVLV